MGNKSKQKFVPLYIHKKVVEDNKRLRKTLEIFTRPTNYESRGVKPACCNVLVRIAKESLEKGEK